MNKIEIERVGNGFVVDYGEGEKDCYPVFDEQDGTMNYGIALLTDLQDALGLAGSRHDEKRLVIRISHGDKYECKKQEEGEWCEPCQI